MEAGELERLTQLVKAEILRQLHGGGPSPQPAGGAGTVLAVLTGGYAKVEEALAQLGALSRAGHRLIVLLSRSASARIGKERARTATGASEVLTPDGAMDVTDLLQAVDVVVAPTLSRASANKIAAGIVDSFPTEVLLEALLAGMPVVLVTDACLPRSRVPGKSVRPPAPALVRSLQERLNTLRTFGAELVDLGGLEPAVTRHLRLPSGGASGEQPVRSVITNADVLAVGKGGVLRVGRGSVVTPLARETARTAEVAIREE